MVVGVLSIRLIMRQSRSLKDKRRIMKSLKDRMRNKFNISIAETGMLDNRQAAVLGVAMIGVGRRPVNRVLSSVVNLLGLLTQVDIVDYRIEFL